VYGWLIARLCGLSDLLEMVHAWKWSQHTGNNYNNNDNNNNNSNKLEKNSGYSMVIKSAAEPISSSTVIDSW